MPIKDGLLPEFDQEMANTRKVLDRCPEEKYGWKPHAKSSTMGALATHVANMIGWAVDTMKKDSFDVQPPGAPPYGPPPGSYPYGPPPGAQYGAPPGSQYGPRPGAS